MREHHGSLLNQIFGEQRREPGPMVKCLYQEGRRGSKGGAQKYEGISLMCINVTRSQSGEVRKGNTPDRSHSYTLTHLIT